MHETAPPAAAGPPLHQVRRRSVALGLVVVALILLGVLILIRHDTTPGDTANSETFSPAPGSVLSAVTQIPGSVFDAVGVDSPTNPITSLRGTPNATLWRASNEHNATAKPVVFFYGAEFSPYSDTESWSLVAALSRFGTFSQVGQVQSSGTEDFGQTPGFTVWDVGYSSHWLTLLPVERYGMVNPSGVRYAALSKPTTAEAAVVAANEGTATVFPLVDIANRFTLLGSAFSPAAFNNLSASEIASDLTYPTNPVTQAVLSEANELTAAICAVTGQRPGTVCQAKGVLDADVKLRINPAR
jgi:hypothetical protein